MKDKEAEEDEEGMLERHHGVVGDVCLPIHDVHCVLVPVDIMYRVDPDLHRISNSLDVDPVQKNADF